MPNRRSRRRRPRSPAWSGPEASARPYPHPRHLERTLPMSVTTTLAVTGMTCEHCVNAVRQELGALPGVQQVSVDLVNGGTSQVQVSSDAALDPDQVVAAIDEAGYALAQS